MAQKIKSFEYVPAYGGDTGMVGTFVEAAAQSYKAGDLVFLSSGKVTVCGADPTKILGLAQKDATGVTNAIALVQVIRPGDTYIANYVTGTAYAVGDYQREIVKTAAGNWQIDSTSAANTCRVVVLGPLDLNADGSLSGNDGSAGPPAKPLAAVMCAFVIESGTAVQILQGAGCP